MSKSIIEYNIESQIAIIGKIVNIIFSDFKSCGFTVAAIQITVTETNFDKTVTKIERTAISFNRIILTT